MSVEEPAHSPKLVRFGTFEVDLRAGELWKSGRKRKLAGQPFLVLAMLLERPGEMVTRRSCNGDCGRTPLSMSSTV
jgi:DNA-binding response OmpR family regulator